MSTGTRTRPAADNLAGRAASARAVAAIDKLLMLDDLWTWAMTGLKEADRVTVESQLDELTELVEEMDRALTETAETSAELRMVLESASDEMIKATLNTLAEASSDASRAFRETFSEEITEVGPRGASIFGCLFLLEETENERGLLRDKLQHLRDGGEPDPDLRPAFRCALTLAAMGGFAALGAFGPGPAVAVGYIVDRSTADLLAWKKSKCREAWQTITRGRF